MSTPLMYYINVAFTWLLALLSLAAFFYTSRRTGEKWAFWPILAISWAVFGVSHALLLGGVSTGAWYMTLLRILGYVVMIAAIFSLVRKSKS
jgi:hypothetical protein